MTQLAVQTRILKVDGDGKRLVTGAVLRPGSPDDVDGDKDWITPDEIQKTAHAFMREFASAGVWSGELHEEELPPEAAYLVESWVSRTSMSLGGVDVPVGTWLITVHVPDDELWSKVLDGTYDGFSMEGTGTRVVED